MHDCKCYPKEIETEGPIKYFRVTLSGDSHSHLYIKAPNAIAAKYMVLQTVKVNLPNSCYKNIYPDEITFSGTEEEKLA